MCGIAGIFRHGSGTRETEIARAMGASLAHRGPDGSGEVAGASFALAHRRLAIIDPEGGAQPIATPDGRFRLVYNGEVYNHAELRRDLEARGASFRTSSDTEVVLQALARDGVAALARMNGMFALALVDTQRRKAWLVRDRLGIKPLFWTRTRDSVVFASEPKALFAHPDVSPEPDPLGISAFLSYRHALATRTLYRGVTQVAAGGVVEIDLADAALPARAATWWRLPVPAADGAAPSVAEAAGVVRRCFFDAVRLRMIADVPIGAYLSGGLDSSLIVAVMTMLGKRPVRTFTIGFPEENFSELPFARRMAEACGAAHREIVQDRTDYLGLLDRALLAADGPLAVPNEVALLALSFAMKQVFSVVLSGEGADELFGGYGRIFRSGRDAAVLAALARSPELVANPTVAAFLQAARKAYGDPLPDDHVELFLDKYRYLPVALKHDLLAPEVLVEIGGEEAVDAPLRDHFSRVAHLHPTRQYMHVFQVHHLQGLLRRLDVTTMAAGLEARVPFADHRLVEAVQELPVDMKLRWRSPADEVAAAARTAGEVSEIHDTTKWILREALGDLLPGEIVERRKLGFPVPLGEWLAGDRAPELLDVLSDSTTRERGLWNAPALSRIRRGLRRGDTKLGRHAFYLCCTELWLRRLSAPRLLGS